MHDRKNTILIVNADQQLQKLMSLVLDSADFKIIPCLAGKQALRLAVSTEPDLILLDLALPDIDGMEVLASIREWSQVPMIILTVRGSDDDVVKALNSGANDYVTRPFNADVLLARINAALRKAAIDEVGAPELSNGPLRIDLVRHQVFLNDELIRVRTH